MIIDVLNFSFSDNVIVNFGFTITLENGVFTNSEGNGSNFSVTPNANGQGMDFTATDRAFSCAGSVGAIEFSSFVQCDDEVLIGTISVVHMDVPINVTTSFGHGSYTLPAGAAGGPHGTQGGTFRLPVANAT